MENKKRKTLSENIIAAARDIYRRVVRSRDGFGIKLHTQPISPEKVGVWVSVKTPDTTALEWVGMTEEEWRTSYLRNIVSETRFFDEEPEFQAHLVASHLRRHLN